jgi:predicted transcriptional regulator
MAPNLFIQDAFSFSSVEDGELSKDATEMMNATSRISGGEEDIPALSVLLTKIDQKLDELGKQRAALLHIRNRTMRTPSKAIEGVDGQERKKVIFSILDQHNSNVAYLSKTLDLREVVVRDILKQLRSLLE